MKIFGSLTAAILLLTACGEPATETPAPAAAEEQVNYVYTIEKPDQWEMGSKKNTEIALMALKGWETNNVAGTAQYWGDSVLMEFDNFSQKLGHDSAMAMITNYRASLKNAVITMHDFESVISKDKESEYVSLWYTQVVTDMKGNIDSVAVMNDLKFKNGKIIQLDEKVRKLGPPKS